MIQRALVGVLVSLSLSASVSVTGCARRPAGGEGTETAPAAPTATAEAQAAPAEGDRMAPEKTIVEESDRGTITWSVTTDGRVEAVIKAPDGRVITKDVSGLVTWPGEAGDDIEYVSLTAEGRVVAEGPPLDADLTEIDYDLMVEGSPWSGVLHVPRGGTVGIEADARADAAVDKPIPAGRKGPNGGVIQIIGGEPVELVADKTTGEVRVYVLGPDLQPIDPGERRIRLGYVADVSETVDLVREPGGLYFVGRMRAAVDPVRVTLAVGVGVGAAAAVHVGIIGFHVGMHLGVGVRAAPVPILVERGWTPSVAVRVGFDGRVKARERVDVGARVDVRDRVRVHERVEVREKDRGGGHDHGVRDHGAGHGRDHGGGHDRGGGRGHGGGGRGKKH